MEKKFKHMIEKRRFKKIMPSPRVLLYHSLGTSDARIAVSPKRFGEHMCWLRKNNIKVYSLREALEVVKRQVVFAARSALVTFDDGYENNFKSGFPVLEKYRIPAVIFLNPCYLNADSSWNHRSAFIESMLTVKQVKVMNENGIDFGSHGLTHHNLLKFGARRLHDEVCVSKLLLEEIIGRQVISFSYPYGQYSPAIKREVARHYQIAFAVEGGLDNWQDIHAVNRVEMTDKTTVSDLERIFFND